MLRSGKGSANNLPCGGLQDFLTLAESTRLVAVKTYLVDRAELSYYGFENDHAH